MVLPPVRIAPHLLLEMILPLHPLEVAPLPAIVPHLLVMVLLPPSMFLPPPLHVVMILILLQFHLHVLVMVTSLPLLLLILSLSLQGLLPSLPFPRYLLLLFLPSRIHCLHLFPKTFSFLSRLLFMLTPNHLLLLLLLSGSDRCSC